MRLRGHVLTGLVSLVVIAFLWAPLVGTAVNSLNKDSLLVGWGGATLRWFGVAFRNDAARSGLRTTLGIAFATSLLSLALAVTGALWWRKASPRAQRVFDLMTYLRIILPEVVFAVALFLLFARLRLPLGIVAVVIGHTVWNSAYATLIMQARVVRLDPALEDAAADLGATPVRTFWRVTVPGLVPAIVAAGLLTFTFSFDDVVTSFYLAGSQIAPLPVVLLSMIRFRVSPQINAIGILVMLFTVTTMALVFFVVSRTGGRSQTAFPAPALATGASDAKAGRGVTG